VSQSVAKHSTLVWIDSREAYLVRWPGGADSVEHLLSDVPPHHRATGTGQHDPGRSPYGGGVPQPEVEGRRLEHLSHFISQAAARVPTDDSVLILGPGTVREQLYRDLAEADERAHRPRTLATRPSGPLTVRQMVATLRTEAGDAPKRKPIKRRAPASRRPSRQAEPVIEEELI